MKPTLIYIQYNNTEIRLSTINLQYQLKFSKQIKYFQVSLQMYTSYMICDILNTSFKSIFGYKNNIYCILNIYILI